MTTQTTTTQVQVRSTGAGRPLSSKSARVRRSVLSVVSKADASLSTKDIAKKSKQSKYAVLLALRWLESQGVVMRTGTVAHEGRGRPMATWTSK